MGVFDKIREWGELRKLYSESTAPVQYRVFMEEVGELGEAMITNEENEVRDAIGDCIVVLTHIAKFYGFTTEECIEYAYEQIKNRRGLFIRRKFTKYEDLPHQLRAIVDAQQPKQAELPL